MSSDLPPVMLPLRPEQLLVLPDLLGRWETDGTIDALPFEDKAEQRVLWDLAASLEPLVMEAFSPNYAQAVAEARAAVRDTIE